MLEERTWPRNLIIWNWNYHWRTAQYLRVAVPVMLVFSIVRSGKGLQHKLRQRYLFVFPNVRNDFKCIRLRENCVFHFVYRFSLT